VKYLVQCWHQAEFVGIAGTIANILATATAIAAVLAGLPDAVAIGEAESSVSGVAGRGGDDGVAALRA
jgi:hypothetical protein